MKLIDTMNENKYLPHLIKLRNALNYLDVDRSFFNKEVKPFLTEISIGGQEKIFDKLELDNWIDHYKQCNSCFSAANRLRNVKEHQNSITYKNFDVPINKFSNNEFTKVLEQVCSKKRKIYKENLKAKTKLSYKNILASWTQLSLTKKSCSTE